MDHDVANLLEHAQQEISAQRSPNRFIDLLEAGEVPAERLGWLAGELYGLVGSDQRSFAFLASRFPAPPAGGFFLAMANGEAEAMRLLMDYAAAVDMTAAELDAYEPRPLAQAYPAYLAQTALFRGRSAVPLALLANVARSGGGYARVADALRARYGLSEQAVGHFRFFSETPRELLDQAADTVEAGIREGEDPREAVRTARLVHAYETAFWAALAEGLDGGRPSRPG